MTTKPTSERKAAILKWLKKVGVWGFLFFLIKGLIWLAIGYWALK
ncbi:alanyl-tRNA synthetase [Pedobacter frigoris]|nr:alanyl-tRNA synthetase [Pedobacter frigoris]